MPILVTQQILAATKQPSAGWSYFEFKEYKKKQSKKSTGVVDDFYIFEGISGPGNTDENAGRAFTLMISGNAMAQQVTEACANQVGVLTALMNCSAEDLVGEDIDPTKLYGKKIWIEIKDEAFEGRILKKANAFTPDGVVPF